MLSVKTRKGFTTGAAAAAAAKAAAILLAGGRVTGAWRGTVDIELPDGRRVSFEIHDARFPAPGRAALATVIKDSGDDPDVTNGMEISARVKLAGPAGGMVIKGGEGIGVVTKAGLQVPVGEPAINPVPRRMIRKAVREALPEGGVEVEISAPRGREIAVKTFNERLGIVGGISIIGTTGIVEPMSLESLKATIRCEIDVVWEELRERGGPSADNPLFLAPGRIGEEALKGLFPGARVVQMGNFAGFALGYARRKGVTDVVVGGHPGKLAKILMGHMDTHSRNSPRAAPFVAEFLGLGREFNTVEEIIHSLQPGAGWAFSLLAEGIAERVREAFGFTTVEVCLFDMGKGLIGRGRCER